jgi:hypothetical protein
VNAAQFDEVYYLGLYGSYDMTTELDDARWRSEFG